MLGLLHKIIIFINYVGGISTFLTQTYQYLYLYISNTQAYLISNKEEKLHI